MMSPILDADLRRALRGDLGKDIDTTIMQKWPLYKHLKWESSRIPPVSYDLVAIFPTVKKEVDSFLNVSATMPRVVVRSRASTYVPLGLSLGGLLGIQVLVSSSSLNQIERLAASAGYLAGGFLLGGSLNDIISRRRKLASYRENTIYLHSERAKFFPVDIAHEYTHHIMRTFTPSASRALKGADAFEEGMAYSAGGFVAARFYNDFKDPALLFDETQGVIYALHLAKEWIAGGSKISNHVAGRAAFAILGYRHGKGVYKDLLHGDVDSSLFGIKSA
jgi:hypothetical protein